MSYVRNRAPFSHTNKQIVLPPMTIFNKKYFVLLNNGISQHEHHIRVQHEISLRIKLTASIYLNCKGNYSTNKTEQNNYAFDTKTQYTFSIVASANVNSNV